MERALLVLGMTVALLADSRGQAGTTYRFRSTTGVAKVTTGVVWLLGDDARLERDPGDSSASSDRVMIWKNGGKQVFVLDTKEHTYFDQVAYFASKGLPTNPSLDTLTVRDPFIISGVSKIRVDVRTSPQPQPSGATPECRPVAVSFSYDLKLSLKVAPVTMPGHVKGVGEYCLSESPSVGKLPFGHGVAIVTGIAEVDPLVADRLAPLKGLPVHSALKVTRQIEGGEEVSATQTLDLSDFQPAEIPLDRFAVPEGFRYREPIIQAPVRQDN